MITILFGADEDGDQVSEASFTVPTVDDNRDEPDEESFVLYLSQVESVNPDGIDLTTRPTSTAQIIDDEGEE